MLKTIISIVLIGALSAGIIWWIYGGASSKPVAMQGIDAYNAKLSSGTPVPATPVTKPTDLTTSQTQHNQKKYMNATFHTNKGDITLEFFSTQAPNTVANFTKLAQSGFYDGIKFHRVIQDFMIQGGDPLTKDDAMKDRWGTGGPDYTFADEITPGNKNDEGTISMANRGPNTNGSQFFINLKNNNFLDQKHTVFGKVTQGMEVVRAIEAVPTNQNDQPLEPVIIKNITLK